MNSYNPSYISTVEKIDERHRKPIILHKNWHWYFAEFETIEQLDFFAKTLGLSYTLREEKETFNNGIYREYNIDRKIDDDNLFWKLEDIPANAKPIKALSNGRIVTCYYLNDGDTIHFYRPNPNAEDVYKPLPLKSDLEHRKTYGIY